MRRCPECFEVYENSEKFCELDGRPLLADPVLSVAGEVNTEPGPEGLQLKRESWLTGLVGVMAGIVICVGVYAGYMLGSIEAPSKDQKSPVYASRIQDQLQQGRPAPKRIDEPTPAPIEEPSPELEVEPSLESSAAPSDGAAEDHKVAARLNQGPVSTGPRKKEDGEDGERIQTIVQMNDGTTIEVDAAWEDSQGVWYRRGGLVSFVESGRVKAITARPEPKLSAASNQ